MGRKRATIIIDRPKEDTYRLDHITLALRTVSVYQGYIDGIHEFATVQKSGACNRSPREMNIWDHMIKNAKNLEPMIFEKPPGMRWCSKCGDWVNERGFSPDKRNRDGLHVWCKTCRAEHERKMYYSRKGQDVA